jgi:hypothetical protein
MLTEYEWCPQYTYPFFEFEDDLTGEIILCVVVLVIFVLFFTNALLPLSGD